MGTMWMPLVIALFLAAVTPGLSQAASAYEKTADTYTLTDLDDKKALLRLFKQRALAAQESPAYETAWKASMWAYYVWQKATPKSQLAEVAKLGIRFGKQATELNPNGAEGWFWYGAAVGIYGLSKGPLESLHLVPEVEKSFIKSRKLDAKYYAGAADRNLARLYMMLPGAPISIGNDARAKAILDASLVAYPDFPLTYIYLADWYWKKGDFEKSLEIIDRVQRLPMKDEGNAFFLPWVKRQVAKIRPRIEKREPRGLLDPMME